MSSNPDKINYTILHLNDAGDDIQEIGFDKFYEDKDKDKDKDKKKNNFKNLLKKALENKDNQESIRSIKEFLAELVKVAENQDKILVEKSSSSNIVKKFPFVFAIDIEKPSIIKRTIFTFDKDINNNNKIYINSCQCNIYIDSIIPKDNKNLFNKLIDEKFYINVISNYDYDYYKSLSK